MRLNAVGEHWAVNTAAALLMASQTGVSIEDAAQTLSGYAPPPGRGVAEAILLPDGGEAVLIDDAYNANPASMRAALEGLARRKGARRLVALGEMLEIGAGAETAHEALAVDIAAAGADTAFLAGGLMQALAQALPGTIRQHWAVKADDLSTDVKNTLRDGDVILIKGSNASGMGRLANELREWSADTRRVMERGEECVAGVENDL